MQIFVMLLERSSHLRARWNEKMSIWKQLVTRKKTRKKMEAAYVWGWRSGFLVLWEISEDGLHESLDLLAGPSSWTHLYSNSRSRYLYTADPSPSFLIYFSSLSFFPLLLLFSHLRDFGWHKCFPIEAYGIIHVILQFNKRYSSYFTTI